MPKIEEQTGFWITGMNSHDDPAEIAKTSYVCGYNILNRGGQLRTRPGFREACEPPTGDTVYDQYTPQGATYFRTRDGALYYVVAFMGTIYAAPYPFTTFQTLPVLSFVPHRQIVFGRAMRSARTRDDGSLEILAQPYPVLIIQDGVTRAGMWDGILARHLDPTPTNVSHETPTGTAMTWCGSRLWVGNGRRLRASNFGDPLKFTDEDVVSEGRFFVLPHDITCMGQTPDLLNLLVMTDEDTSVFQASIYDRAQWRNTPGFQKVLFPSIGAVGPKAFVNQYGLSIWMSHGGLIGLDNALQTYRTSRIVYRDQAMLRSKIKLCSDLSRVALTAYENFLLVSVPSGSRHNVHTWIMDQSVMETDETNEIKAWASIWTGIRPIEWTVVVVDGRRRCFCLSRDYVPDGTRYQYRLGIWEAFVHQRADSLLDGTAKRITCAAEFRTMLFSKERKTLTAYELDLGELSGTTNIRMFYAGRRSAYQSAGTKQVVASMGNFNSPQLEEISQDSVFQSYRRQQRIIRTTEIKESSNVSVQAELNRNIDLGFSAYVEWDGEMAIRALRMFAEPFTQSNMGIAEKNETTQRYVAPDGTEEITDDPPVEVMAIPGRSHIINSFSARRAEPEYSSR